MNLLLSAYTSSWIFWVTVLLVPLVLYLAYLFYIKIPRDMARKRHRDPLPWILLGFCISPFWVIIILLIVGDSA